MKLSSITIVKNEAAKISDCLDSLQKCIDDIVVVVDNNSSDGTLDIVKSFVNVTCITSEWLGYVGSKELALSKTQYNWVLWVDGDEVLSDDLISEINQFKEREPKCAVYAFPRKANFLGKWIKHSGWYPNYVERLFDKTQVHFSDKSVHEHLIYEGKVDKFKFDILHFTDPNIKHYFHKFNDYTSLAAKELVEKNKKFSILDIIIRPPLLFFKMYILKKGFLDGLEGFMLAVFSSTYVFAKYCKLWELNKKDI